MTDIKFPYKLLMFCFSLLKSSFGNLFFGASVSQAVEMSEGVLFLSQGSFDIRRDDRLPDFRCFSKINRFICLNSCLSKYMVGYLEQNRGHFWLSYTCIVSL